MRNDLSFEDFVKDVRAIHYSTEDPEKGVVCASCQEYWTCTMMRVVNLAVRYNAGLTAINSMAARKFAGVQIRGDIWQALHEEINHLLKEKV